MRSVGVPMASLLFACVLAVQARAAEEPAAEAENRKIEMLLKAIADSKLTFIRNGDKHPGKDAADHIRSKWKAAADKVKSAEDFIATCATQSSLSGKPYAVLAEDGKTATPLAVWLREKLKSETPASKDK